MIAGDVVGDRAAEDRDEVCRQQRQMGVVQQQAHQYEVAD
jgi:hypothetical protein